MGWGNCGTDSKGRPIGYVFEATCDHPGCTAEIDRGLSYACGGMHGQNDGDCEGYFCGKHLASVEDPDGRLHSAQLCEACKNDWNANLVEDLMDQIKELEARTMTPTDAQLAPIRETIRAAIAEWRSSCRVAEDRTHIDLEAHLVGAVLAMAQGGVISIREEGGRPERGV